MADLLTTKRKKKPKEIAVIHDSCTGCGGSPVCQPLCPVDECMNLIQSEDNPAGYIWVDPLKCIGCRRCITKGPEDIFLDGCPWDSIVMTTIDDWEAENGSLPY
ncbi:MAG: 4Fe-4S ferredoxin [Planctomycetes bacterium]|nr:4Fe-4S ferredoxin [Planctomycetota bacterium]